MALDDLKEVIEKLQLVINTHHDYLEKKEARTRLVLINPLLQVLGWEVSNPAAVQIEYQVKTKRADYVLIREGEDKPIAVIEAKGLGNSLEDDETAQAHIYANQAGIDYMIVTDGDTWKMFKAYGRGTLEERQIMEFQLSNDVSHECALQALRMWKPNLASGRPAEAMKPVLDFPDDKKAKAAPVLPDPIPKPEGGRKPQTRLAVTMPNGKKVAHKTAKDTFVEVIANIGVEQVKNLNKVWNSGPLILNSRNPKYADRSQPQLGGYYIMTCSDTNKKKELLEDIARDLDVTLKVEIVPKD